MFNIENQGAGTYLTYEIKDEDKIDALSLEMLTNNKILGVAPVLFTQMNDKKYLKYNVSSKIPVKQLFKGVVTKKRFLSVLSGIASTIILAEEYMVEPSLFVMNTDYIFADASDSKPLLICLPIENGNFGSADIGDFFRGLVFSTQYDQNENCDYVAKLINYLNSVSSLSFSDFKRFVDSINTDSGKRVEEPTPRVQINTIPAKNEVNSEFWTHMTPERGSESTSQSPAKAKDIPKPDVVKSENNNSLKIPKPQKGENAKKAIPEMNIDNSKEKKISLIYLLRHYNKETVELYKAQKGAKTQPTAKKPKKEKASAKGNVRAKAPGNFAIPGANVEIMARPETAINVASPQKFEQVYSGVGSAVPATPQTNNGETTVLISPGETTVLGASSVAVNIRRTAYLIRVKSGEAIAINKPRFRIGKERSYVDYFIGDNTAISRSHADIVERGGRYYIADMNSTNGTFVNGMVVPGGEEAEIEAGARIRLANEEFEFEIR